MSINHVFGNKLEHPILGKHYYNSIKVDNIHQATSILLDSSLPFIPVYTHFLMYDLEPIERPPITTILQYFETDSSQNEKSQLLKFQKQVTIRKKTANNQSRYIYSIRKRRFNNFV